MNCVPGMVTEFAFTPTVTTADMRKRWKKLLQKLQKLTSLE